VIQNLGVDHRQCLLQFLREDLVGVGGLAAPGRVVVDVTFPESLCCGGG
jgi:hypothetical protein